MSIIETLKGVVGADGAGSAKKRFACNKCDHEFESFKREDRTACPECLSNDVEVVETL